MTAYTCNNNLKLPDPSLYQLGDTMTDRFGAKFILTTIGWTQNSETIPVQSAVAVLCPADTTEDILVSIPLQALSGNGSLCLYTQWSFTNNANVKTLRVRLGGIAGAQYGMLAAASNVGASIITNISNRGVQNSQVGYSMGVFDSGVSHGTGKVVSSVDMSVAGQTLLITAQKATAGDVITLENYQLEWLPA